MRSGTAGVAATGRDAGFGASSRCNAKPITAMSTAIVTAGSRNRARIVRTDCIGSSPYRCPGLFYYLATGSWNGCQQNGTLYRKRGILLSIWRAPEGSVCGAIFGRWNRASLPGSSASPLQRGLGGALTVLSWGEGRVTGRGSPGFWPGARSELGASPEAPDLGGSGSVVGWSPGCLPVTGAG